ncbi:MAG: hypothetical protein HY011_33725 [Acidobacteria bacterium]|nr:hypothetical protein [Acidobacteriota bacterium]
MKLPTLNLTHFLILFGVTLAAFETQARPPVQHPAQGVVQSIDLTNHTLVLTEPKAATSRIFIWKDSTRFRVGWQKASPDSLHAGQPIKVYYRRESGRLVLREVRWSKEKQGKK